ncbi:MAG: DUF4411 family protein [bacterium]
MNLASPKYIVDTCSFTTRQRVYPIDIFPGVWDLLENLTESGVAGSVEDVFEELKYQDDFLLKWASKHRNVFFPLDQQIQTQASVILNAFGHLVDLKKRKSGADPFIIAAAMVKSSTVVTEEKPSGGPHKVKIPDVCKAYKIRCVTILDVLRAEGLKLR